MFEKNIKYKIPIGTRRSCLKKKKLKTKNLKNCSFKACYALTVLFRTFHEFCRAFNRAAVYETPWEQFPFISTIRTELTLLYMHLQCVHYIILYYFLTFRTVE